MFNEIFKHSYSSSAKASCPIKFRGVFMYFEQSFKEERENMIAGFEG